MAEKLTRCAIYIRVSTAEQQMHGKSLGAQEEYLVRYAEEHGMFVTGVYADEGKTARKELKKRKAIHSLLNAVKRNEIDVILFWRIDRWFRNMSDFYKVQDILDEYNVKWISASEPGMSMDTRDGRLQLNVVLSIGQNEVDTTSERIRFVNESSIRQGKLIFGWKNMPFGFTTGIDGNKKCMIKDQKTEHMVDDFFRYYRQHQNKSATVRYMQDTYRIDFSYTMLRTMLSSEFYKGCYRGFPYCPAYLTEDEWNEIQRMSGNNIKRSRSNRIYLFSGLMHCPLCGQKLVGTGCSSIINRQTKEKRSYSYYRCNKAHIDKICTYKHRLSQNLAEEYLLNNLENEYKKFTTYLDQIDQEKEKKRASKSPEKISAELDRLNIIFQKGRVSWEYYTEEYNRLEKELEEIGIVKENSKKDFSYLEEMFETDFRTAYNSLDPENRRSFWRTTIKQIHLNEDSTIKNIDFV